MTGKLWNLQLRPATADDSEFAYTTTRDTMREYALATWGKWNEEDVRVNPAFNLYLRMGFKVVEETPERYFMEHSP